MILITLYRSDCRHERHITRPANPTPIGRTQYASGPADRAPAAARSARTAGPLSRAWCRRHCGLPVRFLATEIGHLRTGAVEHQQVRFGAGDRSGNKRFQRCPTMASSRTGVATADIHPALPPAGDFGRPRWMPSTPQLGRRSKANHASAIRMIRQPRLKSYEHCWSMRSVTPKAANDELPPARSDQNA